MIRSMLKVKTDPVQSDAVIARFARSGVFEASIELTGALSCEMLQDVESPETLIVLALWESQEAYSNWLNLPARAQLTSGFSDLDITMVSSVFEIRTQVSAEAV